MKTLLILLAVYFCSPTGNGAGTSYSAPCSFTDGLKKLSTGGDTLYCLGGQYNLSNQTNFSASGNSRRNIVIASYPGEQAILDYRKTKYGTRGLCISGDYVHVRDLTIRYSGKNNLYNSGSHNTFENLDIYGSADTGCQMKGGGDNLILNVDSHHNFDYQHYGSAGADFGGNADGFADKQFTGAGNHYVGCRSWANSDDGWDFYDRTSSSETIIEDCICYQNGPAEYDMRNHPRYEIDKAWFDQINGSTITNRYGENQVVTLEHYPNHGNGNGFKLGGNYSTHNVLIHHCLAVANTVRGFDQNNNFGQMRVYNNTGYRNGINFGFGNTSGGTLYIRNNLSYRTKTADSYVVLNVPANDHNSWQQGLTAAAADFISLDTTHILDARQSDGSYAPTSLMCLTATSALIDAGINVGLAYNGSAPDLGWREAPGEYHPAEGTDPDTPPTPTPVECPENTRKIAYVSTPNDVRDTPILNRLKGDSICVTVTDAADPEEDYSDYDLIIISGVPNSKAAAILPLRDIQKPKLVLKSFMLKQGVWSWCTANNTALSGIEITDPTHPIFANLTSPLSIFSRVETNGITTMTSWTVSGHTTLATANGGQDVIVEMDNEPTLIIGISEYSYLHFTPEALTLIEQCVYYMLGMEKPEPQPEPQPQPVEQTSSDQPCAHPVLINGRLYLPHLQHTFNILGRRVG